MKGIVVLMMGKAEIGDVEGVQTFDLVEDNKCDVG